MQLLYRQLQKKIYFKSKSSVFVFTKIIEQQINLKFKLLKYFL
jgi:hypothetical protein